jgi:hypothetical protein
MKKWGWKQAIGVLVIVLVLFLIAKRTEDTAVFHRFLARQAEETAVDCGIIPIGTNPEPGYACALATQQTGKGFFYKFNNKVLTLKLPMAG